MDEATNIRLNNIEEDIRDLKETTKDNTKRLNDNDVGMAKMDAKLDNITKVVTKLDKRQEEHYQEAEKNIKEFFKKCFYWVVGICATLILVVLGIKKFM